MSGVSGPPKAACPPSSLPVLAGVRAASWGASLPSIRVLRGQRVCPSPLAEGLGYSRNLTPAPNLRLPGASKGAGVT